MQLYKSAKYKLSKTYSSYAGEIFKGPHDRIDTRNIAEFLIDDFDNKDFDLENLPTLLPPSKETWYEFSVNDVPNWEKENNPFNSSNYTTGYSEINLGAIRIKILDIGMYCVLHNWVDPTMRYGKDDVSLPLNAALTLDCYLFSRVIDRDNGHEYVSGGKNELKLILDKDGQNVTLRPDQFEQWQREIYDPRETPKAIFYSHCESVNGIHEAIQMDKAIYVSSLVSMAKFFLLANCFLAAKNTVLIDRDMALKLNPTKRKKRKVKRIGKKRKTGYKPRKIKLIAIDPLKTKVRVQIKSKGAKTRKNKRLKSHFRHYSKDRPMFGRIGPEFYGTFFIPGFNNEAIKVAGKDYIIKL